MQTTSKDYIPQSNEITRLSAGTTIKQGILISQTDVRIDGKFDGTILTTGKLIIGETADVNAEVTCKGADIWGKLRGNIVSGECLSLKNTADYEGTINITNLAIEKGARFIGTCKMIEVDEFNKVLSSKMAPELSQKVASAPVEPETPDFPDAD